MKSTIKFTPATTFTLSKKTVRRLEYSYWKRISARCEKSDEEFYRLLIEEASVSIAVAEALGLIWES